MYYTFKSAYQTAVEADVMEAIKERYTMEEIAERLEDRGSFEEQLNDELWVDDSVTGNASGSYTFNSCRAREYVLDDMGTVRKALEEFCTSADEIAEKFLNEDWEYFDVTARCYCLSGAIAEVLDTLEEEAAT